MAITNNKGLEALPGLYEVDERTREAFLLDNEDKLKAYKRNPKAYRQRAEVLYNNKKFRDAFGEDEFNRLNNGTKEAYDYRNQLFREKIIGDAFDARFNPVNEDNVRSNKAGLGDDYEKYNMLPADDKLKILQSDYLSNSEFENNWKNEVETYQGRKVDANGNVYFDPRAIGSTAPISMVEDARTSEAEKQRRKERNDRILENIYSEAADKQAEQLSGAVSKAIQDPSIVGGTDDETIQMFIKAINPAPDNLPISEYAAHYGNGGSDITSEMKNFSIDEMREVLAKKAVYNAYMSPDMANVALNNDAKRYINDHQGRMKSLYLFGKDVGIASLSYTADKVNGFYEFGLLAKDGLASKGVISKPEVYVDVKGNVVDTTKHNIQRLPDGSMGYVDEQGEVQPVQRIQTNYTTLHQLGKNTDGSDEASAINPQYWTKAEMYGELDKDKQDKWERIGASPNKVTYNPGDDRDLLYESFKMMSFGLADAGAQLVPYGIGMVGKGMSTMNKIGGLGRALGRTIDGASKLLTAETKAGRGIQAIAGAAGIAHAYQRGHFSEELQYNLANLESEAYNRAYNNVQQKYDNPEDTAFREAANNAVLQRANELKAQYIQSGDAQNLDESALNELVLSQAKKEVYDNLVSDELKSIQNSSEYTRLLQQAINSAGVSSVATFIPEALKYGFVNTLGYRKFLYSQPTSLTKRAQQIFKGIVEKPNAADKMRLVVEKSGRFATRAAKNKTLAKTLGSQIWGGAWTNGTDDMQVDAAERINRDSYAQYLASLANGEAMSETYGFADGIYSYWKGLMNSLGQQTTLEAAAVGGFGSVVSATPHFVNIASLFSANGREAYRQRYKRAYERDEQGFIKKEKTKEGIERPVTRDIPLSENWRDRLGFFIQNGVLNTYYGAKIEEQQLQEHADFVNNLLDSYNDFVDIESLVASNLVADNVDNAKDEKTMRFIRAIEGVNALENLANDAKDPTTLSTVVNNAKGFIKKAAQITEENNPFSEEETAQLLGQYYSQHPGLARNEANDMKALSDIAQNAKKLQEAAQAYNAAEEHVKTIEQSLNRRIDPIVRKNLKFNYALSNHWRDRIKTMREEINDTSDLDGTVTASELIPTIGSRGDAERLVQVYERQDKELEQEIQDTDAEITRLSEKAKKAEEEVNKARSDSDRFIAQVSLSTALAEVSNAEQQKAYLEGIRTASDVKKRRVQEALKLDESETGKVLTADEIMSLEPVARARMLNTENRDFYSKEQQAEIEKLEQQLLLKDGNALQKIQDIANLHQRIKTVEDAFARVSKNPEAAYIMMENQRERASNEAKRLVNQKNANIIADDIRNTVKNVKNRSDVTEEYINDYVYYTLRTVAKGLLDIIQQSNLLPEYQTQLEKALDWVRIVTDIHTLITKSDKDDVWKERVKSEIDAAIADVDTRDEIVAALEKVIDNNDDTQIAEDFEEVLKGIENIGLQRDMAVVEARKDRIARQKEEKAKREAEEKRKKEETERAARAAAEAIASKEEAMRNNPENAVLTKPLENVDLGLEGESAEKIPVVSNPVSESGSNETNGIVTIPPYQSSMVKQIGDKNSLWKYYTEDNKNIRKVGDNLVILGTSWQGTVAPAINYAVDCGILDSKYKLDIGKAADPVQSNLAREAVQELIKLGIKTPSQLVGDVEQYNGRQIPTAKNKGLAVGDTVEYDNAPHQIVAINDDNTVDLYNPIVNSNIHLDQRDARYLKKQVKSEEVAKPEEPQPTSVNDLLKDDIKSDVTMEVGETWYNINDNPQKGTLVVTKKIGKAVDAVPTITFGVREGGEALAPMLLTIKPDTWTFDSGFTGLNKEQAEKSNLHTELPAMVEKLEYVNGNWYAVATFADDATNTNYFVKLKNDFDLGEVIEEAKANREVMAFSQGSVEDSSLKKDNDGNVYATTNDELETADGTNRIENLVDLNDIAKEDETKQSDVTENKETLSGNKMSRYVLDLLRDKGVLKRKVGTRGAADTMNPFFEWADAEGIKYQDVIDRELHQIVEKNPHAKLKFMTARLDKTNSDFLSDTLFLVMDYDNKENPDITNIHKESDGGVITSDGRKYLVVGIVGYHNDAQQRLYNVLFSNNSAQYGKAKVGGLQWFNEHPGERFRVVEGLSTEIVPDSIVPGYRVKQMESDTSQQKRTIGELLDKKNGRNPYNLTWETIGFGIHYSVEKGGLITTNSVGKTIMYPVKEYDNVGRVFVLVPACNGKYFAGYIEPVRYDGKEVRPGTLDNRIQGYLRKLTSSDYKDRMEALLDLTKVFYLNDVEHGGPTAHNILLSPNKNVVTLKTGNTTQYSVDLDAVDASGKPTFDFVKFLGEVYRWAPRINVTMDVLNDVDKLKEYDEAGVFTTDLAQLALSGSGYRIYPLDSDGNMQIPKANTSPVTETPDVYADSKYTQVPYLGVNNYMYNRKTGEYTVKGSDKAITDERLIKQLDYNRRINDAKLQPVETTRNGWQYYIVGTADNPEVVKREYSTNKITFLSKEDSAEYIRKQEEKRKADERDAAAKEVIKTLDVKDVALEEDNANVELNPETGQFVKVDRQKETADEVKQEHKQNIAAPATDATPAVQGQTQTFEQLINRKEQQDRVYDVIFTKWEDAPMEDTELKQFLKQKNIDVDTIGTTQADIDAWIKTIEDCR